MWVESLKERNMKTGWSFLLFTVRFKHFIERFWWPFVILVFVSGRWNQWEWNNLKIIAKYSRSFSEQPSRRFKDAFRWDDDIFIKNLSAVNDGILKKNEKFKQKLKLSWICSIKRTKSFKTIVNNSDVVNERKKGVEDISAWLESFVRNFQFVFENCTRKIPSFYLSRG